MLTPARIGLFVFVVTSALALFDLYLNEDSIVGNTYSEVIREWANRFPFLPAIVAVFFGALLTHWFAKTNRDGKLDRKAKAIAVATLLAMVLLGLLLGLFW